MAGWSPVFSGEQTQPGPGNPRNPEARGDLWLDRRGLRLPLKPRTRRRLWQSGAKTVGRWRHEGDSPDCRGCTRRDSAPLLWPRLSVCHCCPAGPGLECKGTWGLHSPRRGEEGVGGGGATRVQGSPREGLCPDPPLPPSARPPAGCHARPFRRPRAPRGPGVGGLHSVRGSVWGLPDLLLPFPPGNGPGPPPWGPW